MNILFVHEVDWLAKVVFDIHFLAEGLSLLGHKVSVIDYENEWKRDGLLDMGSLRTKEISAAPRAFDGASVCLRRPGIIKVPGLSRISAAFTHYFELRKTIREKGIDAIILYSVPTNGLQTICAARKFNIPVVFRSIDILSILVPHPVLRPATRALEKWVYSKADMVLPNTPRYVNYIASMGVADSRVRLLPFPIDTRLFRPSVDCSDVRQKWGFGEGDKIIVFIGTLFDFSGLDVFIRQFPQVVKEVPEAKLLIVGDGPQRPKLERIIAELGMEGRVTITGFQPYQTMPQYINLATVCINPFIVSKTTMDIFPAKIVQYIACGRAAVATALRGITTLLPGESHGVVYAAGAGDMAAEVTALLKSPERRQRLERAGLDHVRQTYSYDKITRELEEILENMVGESRQQKKAAPEHS